MVRGCTRCEGAGERLLLILVPVLDGRQAGVFLEDHAEGLGVGVADVVHDLVDVFAAGLEAALGGLDLDALVVFEDRVVRGAFEAALEAAAADPQLVGELLDADALLVMRLQEVLRLEDLAVLVAFLPLEERKGGLAVPVDVDGEVFGGQDGRVAVGVFLHEVEQQVPIRIGAAAGINALVLRHDAAIDELDLGIQLAELILETPMRRALFAVEQAGLGKQEGPHTQRGDLGPARALLLYPGYQGRILGDGRLHVAADGRDDDQVAVLDVLQARVGAHAEDASV